MAETSVPSVFHRRVGWLVLAALLFLRIPFTIFVTYMFPANSGWGPAIYQLGTYVLTACLVWWERNDWRTMHMDTLSVGIIILFKPVQTLVLYGLGVNTPAAFPRPAALVLWGAAAGLLLALWFSRQRMGGIGGRAWAWLTCGLVTGIVFSALRNFEIFQINAVMSRPSSISLPSVAASTGLAFLYQIGFAAISEEPLFRGFLWGYLRRAGWKEAWVWLVQAAIFTSAHVYFMNALAFNFWIVVPLAGSILGLFAWRTRSIAPGMMAHAAYNASAYLILLRVLNF
ncbi:MAG: CPBP family intramembrane glutamic endopeptidase [Chloroflexota bacterium]